MHMSYEMGRTQINQLNVRTSLPSFAQDIMKSRTEIADQLEQVFGMLACECELSQ